MTLCSRLTFGLVCLCLIFLLLKPVFMLSGALRFAMKQNTPILVQALVRDTHVRTHILNTPIQHTTKQHTQHTHISCALGLETLWPSGKFGALHPQGRRFEHHSSRLVGTLGKSFTRNCPYNVMWRPSWLSCG